MFKLRSFLIVAGLMVLATDGHTQEITVNPGKYFDYYHMEYQLTAGEYTVNTQYGFNPGGQFEIFVPKALFPIPAPNCRKHIIIRMPYSQSEDKKRALYESLLASETRSVILELNPYVTVVNPEPLQLELQYCNVFFRHRAGDYYDKL